MPGQRDGLVGAVGPRAGDDRDAAFDRLDGERHHALMLLMRERSGLAGGAAGDDPVRAVGELKLDEIAQRPLVDPSFPEGGDHRDYRAGKHVINLR